MKKLLLVLLMLFANWAYAAVDLNSADETEFQTVPGVGPKKSKAIVEYRKAHGPFKSIDDLKSVPGFGEKTVAGMRSSLTLGGAGGGKSGKSAAATTKASKPEAGPAPAGPAAAPAAAKASTAAAPVAKPVDKATPAMAKPGDAKPMEKPVKAADKSPGKAPKLDVKPADKANDKPAKSETRPAATAVVKPMAVNGKADKPAPMDKPGAGKPAGKADNPADATKSKSKADKSKPAGDVKPDATNKPAKP